MKRILFVSTFRGPSGYSVAARGYLKCLDSYLQAHKDAFELKLYTWNIELANLSQDEIDLVSKYELKNNNEALAEFCEKDYEVVWFLTPGAIIDNLKFKEIFKNSKKNTSCVVWETDRVPDFWLDNYKKYFNQIIVPCEWNREVFSKQTGLPTYKIPYLLDSLNNSLESKKDNIFNIFSMSQWTHRKGFDLLIRAYCSEFYHQDDVLLTIKTYGHGPVTGRFEDDRMAILQQAKIYKQSISHYTVSMKSKINIITGLLSKSDIKTLYANTDVFCLPTRGEGFGLTIAESISYEKPVIVPDKGGHIDYIHKDNFFIESKLTGCYNSFTIDYSSVDMKFIEPDVEHLRIQLRKAYNMWKEDPKQLQTIGIESRKFLQEYCNPEKITQDLVKTLIY